MGLFDDISGLTNSTWSSTPQETTGIGDNLVSNTSQDLISKPDEQNIGKDNIGKIAGAVQGFTKSFGGKPNAALDFKANIASPQTSNLGNFVPSVPQLGIQPLQIPQMGQIPQMNPVQVAVSDYRAKKNIQNAIDKLDNILNTVYQNVVNKRK